MKNTLLLLAVIVLLPLAVNGQPKGYWRLANSHPPSNFAPFIIDSTFLLNIDTSLFFSTSTDGGDSWSALSTVKIPTGYFSPINRSLFYAFEADSQTFLGSSDGGMNWQNISRIQDSISTICGFTMWNLSSGFLLYIDIHHHYHDLVTHDGGISFSDLGHDSLCHIIGNNGNGGITSLKMMWLDSLNGLLWNSSASHFHNTLLVTHNAAKDWKPVRVFSPSGDTTVRFDIGSGHGGTYIFFDKTPKPYFYCSTDFGDQWFTSDSTSAPTTINYAALTGSTSFWTTGQATVLYYTSDLGKHWISDFNAFRGFNAGISGFPDSLHGFAIGNKIGHSDTTFFFKFIAGSDAVNNQNSEEVFDFDLYPNPCDKSINLRTAKPYKGIYIFNLLGECVQSSNESEQSVFDTSRLSDGIYILESIYNNGTSLKKSFLKITQ